MSVPGVMIRCMDLTRFFADVDAQPWADLHHAYGSAADIPDCLRALAGESEEAASEAISELYGSILHQGSVYGATARAVPYLARLAGAGYRTEDLLVLLGGIAEGGADEGDSDEAACRAAVVGQLPLILAKADAEDPGLRRAAAWAAAMTGAAEQVLPVLRLRRKTETDPGVRAELLGAMAHLDPPGTAADATAAIGAHEPAEVRIVALLACVDGGLPWGPAHHAAMLSLLPVNDLVEGRLDLERNEPLQYVVEELLRRDTDADRDAAYTLLDGALRSADSEARAEALWAAETACLLSRSAPERLAGAVEAMVADPADAPAAYSLLAKLGVRAAAAAPVLARLAAGEGDPADRALEALVAVAPDRAAPLLARDLGRRPRALGAACGFLFGGAAGASFTYDPELLDAIRTRLAEAGGPGADEVVRLVNLLGAWGSRASAALPELSAVLPLCPGAVPKALVAICPPEHRGTTAELLTAAARTGPEEGRLAAAAAVRELTGRPARCGRPSPHGSPPAVRRCGRPRASPPGWARRRSPWYPPSGPRSATGRATATSRRWTPMWRSPRPCGGSPVTRRKRCRCWPVCSRRCNRCGCAGRSAVPRGLPPASAARPGRWSPRWRACSPSRCRFRRRCSPCTRSRPRRSTAPARPGCSWTRRSRTPTRRPRWMPWSYSDPIPSPRTVVAA